MKKLLLTLALAVGALSMSAEPITVDFTSEDVVSQLPLKNDMEVNKVYNYTFSNVAFKTKNCYQGTKYNSNPTYLMLFAKATGSEGCYVEFTLPEKLEQFTITTGTTASTNVQVKVTANGVDISALTKLDKQQGEFTFSIPEANQAAGTAYQIVVDGKKYNGQIEKIVFNGDGTPVEPPTPVENLEVANIKAFIDAANTASATTITSPVTAVYKNGRYLYVNDATGNLLVYDKSDVITETYTNGDIIPAGITGTYENYSQGLIQMTSPVKDSFKAATAGTAVEPLEVGLDELGLGMVNQYIVIKNVKVAAAEASNTYTITDENGETATLYNQFNNAQYYDVVTVNEGEGMNVEGFVGCHSGAIQVTPIRVWSENGMEFVADPVFNPASGTVAAGTEVTITCATEGATIYYTLDNSTPTTESAVYSTPFVIKEATAIAAIAVKDGMNNSSVVRASYVVEVPFVVEGDATFNFANPTTLDPAQTAPDANSPSGASLNGVEFTSNGATMKFEGGSTSCRLYYGFNTGVEARLYKTGTVTISAPSGKLISKVNFYASTVNGVESYKNLSYTEGEDLTPVTEATWSSANGVQTAVFTAVEGQATSNGRVDFKGIGVVLIDNTAIEAVIADEYAPVEYFNLQGVRVANPENGLYIRRQGNQVTKVLVK